MAEILYTRTAKVAFGYEYQLLVISLAISGIGLGGIPVFLAAKRFVRGFERLMGPLALIFAALVPVPLFTVTGLGTPDYASANLTSELSYFGASSATMALFCAAVFLVYFLAGIVIAAFLERFSGKVPLYYSLNLMGAALGALAVVPLLDLVGNQTALVCIVAVAAIPALILIVSSGLGRIGKSSAAVVCLAGLVLLWVVSPGLRPGGQDKAALLSASNSFSQIDVYTMDKTGAAKGLSPAFTSPVPDSVKSYNLVYERKLKTNALYYDNLSDAAFLRYDTFYFPYHLLDEPKVLLLGAGGGTDIVRARLAGSESITAVEGNKLITDIARNKLMTSAFDEPDTALVIGEARAYAAGTLDKFDLIYLSNTGGFGGKPVNNRYYPDNFLHTREAYETYFGRLKKDGILAVSNRDVVVKAFIGVGLAALESKGIPLEDSVAYIEGKGFSVAMFKPDGFTERDKAVIAKNASRLRFRASFPAEPFADAGDSGRVTDDNPFLHDRNTVSKLFGEAAGQDAVETELYGALPARGGSQNDDDGLLALRFLAAVALFGLAASLLLGLASPLIKDVRTTGARFYALRVSLYFFAVGAGYMGFQLVMLQRAFLFVGHPGYAVAVVLAAFLLFGGLGSLAAGRIPAAAVRKGALAAGLSAAAILLVYAYFMQSLFIEPLYLSQGLRLGVFLVLLAVPSLVIGLLFPAGMVSVRTISDRLIPWMWGINGLAVVFGGAALALGSYFFGFRAALAAAAACYAAAAVLLPRKRNPSS
jgi:hypothetical protein